MNNKRARIDKALGVIQKHGYNPIGFTYHNNRPLFVFEKVMEARSAFMELEHDKKLVKCWWWSKKATDKDAMKYEEIPEAVRQDVESKRREQEALLAGPQAEEVPEEVQRQRNQRAGRGGAGDWYADTYNRWKEQFSSRRGR